MLKRCIATIVACLMLCVCIGCGTEEQVKKSGYQVYYLNTTETSIESHDYQFRGVTLDEQLTEIMVVLGTTPEKLEYKAPLAMGFSVLDFEYEAGRLTIDMDARYKELSATTEVLVRAAIVKSFTGINGVNFVFFTVDGEPLKDSLGKYVGGMNAVQFIENEGQTINTYDEVRLKLYFANEAGTGLVATSRTKEYNTNIPLEKLVLEELIKGPNAEGVYPTINPDTKVASVIVKDGICYVNLDESFLVQKSDVTPEVTIYSIANSLTELNNVKKVQISVNGDNSILYREQFHLTDYYEQNLDLLMREEE